MRKHYPIYLIAAVAKNGVIGKNNKMPWHLAEDLKHFKKLTIGNPIIMGRKTFQSLSKHLDQRYHIVLTRQKRISINGYTTNGNKNIISPNKKEIGCIVNSTKEALKINSQPSLFDKSGFLKVYVIGGAQTVSYTHLTLPTILRV